MHKEHTPVLLAVLGLAWGVYTVFSVCGFTDAGICLSPVISFFAAFFLFHATANSPNYRTTWLVNSIGVLVWGLASVFFAVDSIALGVNPENNVLLMYLFVVPNLCFLFTVLYIAFYDRRRWSSFQFLVDVSAIFCSVAVFLYYVFDYSHFQALFPLGPVSLSSGICLISDLLILTFTMSIVLSMDKMKTPLFLRVFFVSIILYAFSDLLHIYALFNKVDYSGFWIAALYLLSIAGFGAGAILFLDNPVDPSSIRKQVNSSIALVNRSILLLCLPILALMVRKIHFSDMFPFILIILVHQILSLVIRRLLQREMELDDKSRQTAYFEATIADRMRELRIMNQTLENLLKRDATTGQFNRKYFLECTEDWIKHAESGEKIWLLILDFDRFKTVNDTYGHDVGDHVLRIVGKRLETVSNERTVFARLGGDEFGVVCRRPEAESIRPLLHTIADISDTPINIEQFTVHVSIGIGVACWPDDALTRSDLMRHADIAMYIAKNKRMSGVSFFDSTLNAGIERSHKIDLALRSAIFSEEFTLVYQPQIATGGHRLVGMEALIRWDSPSLGRVTPDEFIPVAEENGVILALSDWITRRALGQIVEWNTCYGLDLLMGINISPYQLDEIDFVEKLEAMMDDYNAKPEWVNLEMTERSAMKGESFIIDIFNRLAKLNISSSIDDFGTGYSSLSYIKKFHIDYLKIAKQLVDGIVTNDTDSRIVQAIIMMATALNVRTIAEGVENEDQLRILESLGCDEIQGYYFGKPELPEKFEELFLKNPEPELL